MDVQRTLEDDIRRCLIKTKLIPENYGVILRDKFYTTSLDKGLTWDGSFNVFGGDGFQIGIFTAEMPDGRPTHSFTGKPTYYLSVGFKGHKITTEYSLFGVKYVVEKKMV